MVGLAKVMLSLRLVVGSGTEGGDAGSETERGGIGVEEIMVDSALRMFADDGMPGVVGRF